MAAIRSSSGVARRPWRGGGGLKADPEHAGATTCGPWRWCSSAAAARPGRRSTGAARRDPTTPSPTPTRAGRCCTEGAPRKAMEHFRETLRLDPTSDWAQRGHRRSAKAAQRRLPLDARGTSCGWAASAAGRSGASSSARLRLPGAARRRQRQPVGRQIRLAAADLYLVFVSRPGWPTRCSTSCCGPTDRQAGTVARAERQANLVGIPVLAPAASSR